MLYGPPAGAMILGRQAMSNYHVQSHSNVGAKGRCRAPREFLPSVPLLKLFVSHTVGLFPVSTALCRVGSAPSQTSQGPAWQVHY